MKVRTSLTKSLHTVTSVSRIAQHLGKLSPNNQRVETRVKSALELLGVNVDGINLPEDETYQACVKATKRLEA